MGCEAYRIEKKSDVEKVLKKALKSENPVVIDCVIEKDDSVYPMVPPGKAISEVFDESDL